MKAIVRHRYGPPEVLRLEEIEKPAPRDGEVLVRVRAASLNPLDWHFMRGAPRAVRLVTGPGKPREPGLGVDLSGQVEAVGPKVVRLKPGDEVYGTGRGTFAEYARAPERTLALKPKVSFEEAAAVPVAGVTSLQALRDRGRLERGQKALINGAGGGVGTFAVQIAKALGAQVTGVCSTGKMELVHSLGADHVLDYTREDFAGAGRRYDLVLDCVGNRRLSDLRRVLTPTGAGVMIGGGGSSLDMAGGMAAVFLLSLVARQRLAWFLASVNTADLDVLRGLIESGQLTPVIDRRYTLETLPEAMAYLEEGHARGKVTITVG